MSKLNVALLYNLKQNAPHRDDEPWDAWNELENERTAASIERALRIGGHEVLAMEGDATLPQKLARYKIDLAFNFCEGHYGVSREAQVPAILDMLRIPYTGAGVLTLALALDKPMAKRVMMFHGLPTPGFQTFITGEERIDSKLKYPLFVKPSREGSGIGITKNSVCRNARELREQVQYIIQSYHQPAIVEEYIQGREFTVGMLGNMPWNVGKPSKNGHRKPFEIPSTLRVFPPLEVDLSPVPQEEGGLYTSVVKSKLYDVPKYLFPAPISKSLRTKMERYSAGAFAALECCDFARVDFRVDKETGQLYILEINPLAGLQEGISDIVMAAEADGIDYVSLINGILDAARQRFGMI